jgi:hypothetical protein
MNAKRIAVQPDHDEECEAALHAELRSLRAHKLRLDRELPLMRKENQRLTGFLQDAAAYVRVMDGTEDNQTLATLVHDINGLANDEPCFLPRVSGYAKAEAQQQLKR